MGPHVPVHHRGDSKREYGILYVLQTGLRANGMVILYEYFGVPLQTTAAVRRKSKGGTSRVSPLPAHPAAAGESAPDAGHWAPTAAVKEGTEQTHLEKLPGRDKYLGKN